MLRLVSDNDVQGQVSRLIAEGGRAFKRPWD